MPNASDLRHLRLGDAEHDSPNLPHDAHEYPHTDRASRSQFLIRIRIGQTGVGADGAAMNFAALVRALMSDAGMTQEALSLALKVSQSSVSRYSSGQQEPAYSVGLRIIDLASHEGLLTNKNGTFKVVPSIEVRGRMVASDEIAPVTDGRSIGQAELPFGVPVGCFAVIVEADGRTSRARKGDLLIVGPSNLDVSSMIEVEGLFRLDDGRYYFGILVEGRDPGRYTILGQHNRRITNVVVEEAAPFFSTVAAGRWQLMT